VSDVVHSVAGIFRETDRVGRRVVWQAADPSREQIADYQASLSFVFPKFAALSKTY